jgi:PTH2 family peptidyl-tRNA hydrolase
MSFEPNRDYLNSLINDLGIFEKKAIKALKITNNTSIEAAASFVFDNLLDEKDDDDDDDDDDELNKFYSEELDRIQRTKEEGNIIEATTMIKMVFVINSSLKMNVSKIAAQVAHAAIDLYEESNSKQPALNVTWQQYGQTKIVLKGTDENELIELGNQAKQRKILTTLIHDAGRTQVKAGSLACLSLFGRVNNIDKITGKLGLLKEC